jgi:hypothetical protein
MIFDFGQIENGQPNNNYFYKMHTRLSLVCIMLVTHISTVVSFAPVTYIKKISSPENFKRAFSPPLMMAKKSFDKKYGDAFDDFRTSGSMPSIPSITEQYKKAQSFVQEQGIPVDQERFGERLTSAQSTLEQERAEGMENYEELKKELLNDTAFIGALSLLLCYMWLPEKQSFSYFIGTRCRFFRFSLRITMVYTWTAGMIGSLSYSFLLTRTADSLGEQVLDNPSLIILDLCLNVDNRETRVRHSRLVHRRAS